MVLVFSLTNKCRRIILLFLICPLLLSAQSSWKNIFNGKDLAGWKQVGGKAVFEAKNEEISGTTALNEPASYLTTEALYDDFILELEFKIDDGLNSGIQFRSESKPEYLNGRVHGYQMEIDPSQRAWTGGLYDESRRDWLYTLEYNPQAKSAYKKNDWNVGRIECIGDGIRIWINGIPTSHVIDNMTRKGFFALQIHALSTPEDAGKQIHWRKIRIQTQKLKPAPLDDIFVVNMVPNSISPQEAKNGTKLLWDGKTLNGWRGAYKDRFPEKGWEMKDGALSVIKSAGAESENGGDVVTKEKYGFFDLQFEFRITEGANSGLKYFVTESEGNKGSAIGLEYQILDDAKHPDATQGVFGNRTQGSLYDLIPSLKIRRGQHAVGEWNNGRVIVYPDNHVEHWLNGYKIVEYHRGSPTYMALVARSKYAQWENFGMSERGHILLQDHGDAVSFRSIKIRELTK